MKNLNFRDPWGGILGGLGLHFGGAGHPWDTRGDVWGSDVVFLSVFGGFWVPVGGHFGVLLVTFSELLVSKWEVRLWTSFLVYFRWKKNLKTVALCC